MSRTMAKEALHIIFFPHLAPSHIMSLLDMAKLFAEHGVRVSIVTTHGNAFRFRPTIVNANRSGHSMQLLLIPFPSAEVGLTEGHEVSSSIAPTPSNLSKFYQALTLLRHPFEQLLRDHRPDCIISDQCYTWTSDLGIPRVLFVPYSPFYLCVYRSLADALLRSGSFNTGDGAGGGLVLAGGLPHRIELARSEIPILLKSHEYLELCQEAERKSYGMVANSFYELTPEYVNHYCQGLGGGQKLWCVGPSFLCNKTDVDQAERGGSGDSSSETWESLKTSWLDLQPHGSVVYVCFGSEYDILSHDQCREIALGLESSGHPFVWVVKDGGDSRLPLGFEERVRGKGVIWRGWAPQLKILNHPAVGGFVTHCGWNSIIEAVSFGLPMIAWPMQWEQFINERLIVEVLGIGIRVVEGAARTVMMTEKEIAKRQVVSCAVKRLMGNGAMKMKAKEFKEMARSAIKEGGSSHANLSRLIEELTVLAGAIRKNVTV